MKLQQSAPHARNGARFVWKRLGLGAVVFVLAGCTANATESWSDEPVGESAEAIAGGYRDSADDAVVGLAVTDDDGHTARTCSGTLIAPNLVLTAQHCIAQTSEFVACDSAFFGPSVSAERVFVTTHASMWSSDTAWLGIRAVLTPPGVPAVCGRDVALVVLEQPLADGLIAPLEPRLDSDVTELEVYSAIGYGATAAGEKDGGVRRRRDGLTVLCTGENCQQARNVQATEWRGNEGICNGDSGGPAIDSHHRVIGVTSRGPAGCDHPIYGSVNAWRSWIGEVGAAAAKAGGYPTPEWVEGRTGEAVSLGTVQQDDEQVASCAAAPALAAAHRAPRATLAFALVLLAAFLRRMSLERTS